jgi:hypothetical protein
MAGDYPTPETRKVFLDRLMQQLRRTRRFGGSVYTTRFRMVFSGNGPVEIDGKTYAEQRRSAASEFRAGLAGFFDVTAQRVLDGRNFTDEDLDRASRSLSSTRRSRRNTSAREPAIGRFRTDEPGGPAAGPWRTIVGVVSNVRMLGPFNNPNVDNSGFYVPFYSTAFGRRRRGRSSRSLRLSSSSRPAEHRTAGAMLRREVARADPNLPLYFIGTPRSQVEVFVAQNRIIAMMFSIFGVVGGGAGVGRDLRGDVVLGQPADAGVRRTDGARRQRRPESSTWCCARAPGRSRSASRSASAWRTRSHLCSAARSTPRCSASPQPTG